MTSGNDPQLKAKIEAAESALALAGAALADLRRYVGQNEPADAWVPQVPTPPEPERRPALIGKDWIEAGEAASRFGVAKDTIRFWCRLKPDVFGIKRGGRWYVSISALKAKLGLL